MFVAVLCKLSSEQGDRSLLLFAAAKERIAPWWRCLVFYDFETTQDTKFSDKATAHIPMLVCLQQFCTACKMQDDIDMDCAHCSRRLHSFFEDTVGDLLSYLCEPRPWCNKVVAIAHNAKAFDCQLILNRAILLNPWGNLKRIKNCQYKDASSPFSKFCLTCPCLYVGFPRHLGSHRPNRGIRIILTYRRIWTKWVLYPTSVILAPMRWGREKGLHGLVWWAERQGLW
jgi:hypothetical protein